MWHCLDVGRSHTFTVCQTQFLFASATVALSENHSAMTTGVGGKWKPEIWRQRNWPLLRATHAPVWRMMDRVCWETIWLTNTNSVVISCFLNNWNLSRLIISSSFLSHLPRFASCSITSHHDLHSKVWTNFHPTRQRAWVDNARQHLGLVTGAQVSSTT